MSDPGSTFQAGLAARHDAAASVLRQAFSAKPIGFAPADLIARLRDVPATSAGPSGPKHFTPADPAANPTEGWDPLDPTSTAPCFVDPLAAAHAAGYAEGVAATTTAITEAGARDRAMIATLVEQLQSGGQLDREGVAKRLRQTVLFLVSKLIGETGVVPELLAGRIEAAAELLADAAESAILRVHPDDVALLEGRLPRTIFPVGDATISRGSFVLEAASTIVEDGPELWLEQLAHAIEHVPVPQC